jgi:hypothetical protein
MGAIERYFIVQNEVFRKCHKLIVIQLFKQRLLDEGIITHLGRVNDAEQNEAVNKKIKLG